MELRVGIAPASSDHGRHAHPYPSGRNPAKMRLNCRVSASAMASETNERGIVHVVDDDASVRDALRNLFRSVGLRTEAFGSAHEFLQHKPPEVPSLSLIHI